MIRAGLTALIISVPLAAPADGIRATGDLGVVIERATGSVLVVDQSDRAALCRVEGLGDLSHASLTFSPDERFAYVFGRDGGLTKLDLLEARIDRRVVQAGNSIGGAISADGRLVAVANYEPGGVKVFDTATLAEIADIPSTPLDDGKRAKVVGLEDAGGRRFAWSLYDTGEIWSADLTDPEQPRVERFEGIGRLLDPKLDIWAVARPVLERILVERYSPQRLGREFRDRLPELITQAPDMPRLLHGWLKQQVEGRHELRMRSDDLAALTATMQGMQKRVVAAILGVGLLIVAAVLYALEAGGPALLGLPVATWVAGVGGVWALLAAWPRR